jgi:hypothetical protein
LTGLRQPLLRVLGCLLHFSPLGLELSLCRGELLLGGFLTGVCIGAEAVEFLATPLKILLHAFKFAFCVLEARAGLVGGVRSPLELGGGFWNVRRHRGAGPAAGRRQFGDGQPNGAVIDHERQVRSPVPIPASEPHKAHQGHEQHYPHQDVGDPLVSVWHGKTLDSSLLVFVHHDSKSAVMIAMLGIDAFPFG